jgi:hypothetical protein
MRSSSPPVWTWIAIVVLTELGAPSPACAEEAPLDKRQCASASEHAQHLRKGAKLADARRELLVCAHDECPSIIKEDCVRWLAELDVAMPSVVPSAVDAHGRDVTDARVLIDGAPLVEALDGTAREVDPGEHRFRFESPGAAPAEQVVVVREGEKRRVIRVELQPLPAGGPVTSAGTGNAGLRLASYVTGAVGVIAMGTAAAFKLAENAQINSLSGSCAPNCSEADRDSASAKLVAANVSLSVGIVALAVAAFLFVESLPSGPPAGGPAAAGAPWCVRF